MSETYSVAFYNGGCNTYEPGGTNHDLCPYDEEARRACPYACGTNVCADDILCDYQDCDDDNIQQICPKTCGVCERELRKLLLDSGGECTCNEGWWTTEENADLDEACTTKRKDRVVLLVEAFFLGLTGAAPFQLARNDTHSGWFTYAICILVFSMAGCLCACASAKESLKDLAKVGSKCMCTISWGLAVAVFIYIATRCRSALGDNCD
jgi:hypothetical protein